LFFALKNIWERGLSQLICEISTSGLLENKAFRYSLKKESPSENSGIDVLGVEDLRPVITNSVF
jgi:hypothetical protein